jgi:hypothetical protein
LAFPINFEAKGKYLFKNISSVHAVFDILRKKVESAVPKRACTTSFIARPFLFSFCTFGLIAVSIDLIIFPISDDEGIVSV